MFRLNDEEQIIEYLTALLIKAFDRPLIYGMGHAVYFSDPANILKGFLEELSKEKGLTEEFDLYNRVENWQPS